MALLDVSGDFESVCNDFQESVTLRIGASDRVLARTMSEPHNLRELEPSGGYVTRNGTLFVWSKKHSPRPPLGSIIIDHDGLYWTVWKVDDKQHVETWEAFCLLLSIVSTDWNFATLLEASYGKGRANEAKATWLGYFSRSEGGAAGDTVLAHFQPLSEDAAVQFSAEWTNTTYKVYFKEPLPVDLAGGEYRLVDVQGQRYRVVRYFQESRIDKLPVAIAVKIVEGAEYVQGSI